MLFQFNAETSHLSWYTSKRISIAERKSFFFFPRRKQKYRVTVTIYAIWVKLSDLNENAAKHLDLYLDPCKVTQPTHELCAT